MLTDPQIDTQLIKCLQKAMGDPVYISKDSFVGIPQHEISVNIDLKNKHIWEVDIEKTKNPYHDIRRKEVTRSQAGAWLNMVPNLALGLQIQTEQFQLITQSQAGSSPVS